MSKAKYCPSCGDPLNPGSRLCTCGWRDKAASVADIDPDHWRCAFVWGGERCRLPGTTADTIRADKGTKFYCRFHFAAKDSGPEAIAAVNKAIATGQIVIDKIDWRDALMAEILSKRKAA